MIGIILFLQVTCNWFTQVWSLSCMYFTQVLLLAKSFLCRWPVSDLRRYERQLSVYYARLMIDIVLFYTDDLYLIYARMNSSCTYFTQAWWLVYLFMKSNQIWFTQVWDLTCIRIQQVNVLIKHYILNFSFTDPFFSFFKTHILFDWWRLNMLTWKIDAKVILLFLKAFHCWTVILLCPIGYLFYFALKINME